MTERDPLKLPDKAEEFRALWALYAGPMETQNQNNTASFKFRTVLELLSISHKYQFDSCEQWAVHMLLKHFTVLSATDGTNQFLDDETLFRNSDLEEILRLFVRVQQPKLREAVERSYMHRFKSNPPPSIPRSLALAEELGSRSLQGLIYYHLATTRDLFQHPCSTAYALPDNDLTEAQKLNSYRGSYSLSLYWLEGPKYWRTIQLPRSVLWNDEEHAYCVREWKDIWLRNNWEVKFVGLPITSLSGPLEKVRSSVGASSCPPIPSALRLRYACELRYRASGISGGPFLGQM